METEEDLTLGGGRTVPFKTYMILLTNIIPILLIKIKKKIFKGENGKEKSRRSQAVLKSCRACAIWVKASSVNLGSTLRPPLFS